jgi:phospholipid/cholesterol/gamma-HCH transport system permease protein
MPVNDQSHISVEETSGPCEIFFEQPGDDTLLVGLRGQWKIGEKLPAADEVQSQLNSHRTIRRIAFDTRQLSGWDSGLLTFLIEVVNQTRDDRVEIDDAGLPKGVKSLLHLATAVPERKGARKKAVREPIIQRIGEYALDRGRSIVEIINFIGAAFLAFLKFLVGKARFQRADLMVYIQQSGAQALPIVTLISVLVGVIFAFIGAVQLMMFGAQIYVADLVGIAMVRVMGAVMTGVPDRHHAGQRRGGRAANTRHIGDGISGPTAHAGPGFDDAAVVHICRFDGYPRRNDRGRRNARY